MDDQLDRLTLFEKSLKTNKFYGTVIQKWENGNVIHMKVEESFKLQDVRLFISTTEVAGPL